MDFFSHIYPIIIVLLFSLSWSYIVEEEEDHWSWIKTKHLTRSNWTSSLKPNTNSSKLHHPVWFIFQYLTYCSHCKSAKPGWEAAAQYAAGWSRYIRIGAFDCGSESQNDICQDEGYPQWRIFCPLTNSTQLAFDSSRRGAGITSEDILMLSIKKINKIAPQCYGKTWPIRQALEPQSRDDLNRVIPKHIKKFQLFISDDILLYSLYVLNNSKTVAKEPIYRLSTQNFITPGNGIWKGIKNDDGSISFEQIDSTDAMKTFVLNKNSISHTEKHKPKKIGSLNPTLTDVDSAIVWMITRDLRRRLPTLFDDVKSWLKIVYAYYPGSETMRNFLGNLITFMNDRTSFTGKELQTYINTTSVIKLPSIQFDHCNGSDPSKRGYTCSLWVLFHGMTVKQAILAEQNQLPSNVQPKDMIESIREFVRNFFLCQECAKHFLEMTLNATNEIYSYKENVLYLWRGHNKVNQRLRNEELTNDPAWPKIPFPSKEQCYSCVRQIDENGDVKEYDENETYNYLKNFYNLHLTSQQKSSAKTQRYNRFFLSILFCIIYLIS